jgi:AraC family transcriptional regulator, positive regulator of tynA and feaB
MHVESSALREGSIGRLRCPPQTTWSLPVDLTGAPTQGVCVLYVLGGHVEVSHAGQRAAASSDTIATFDGATTVELETIGECLHDIVMLEVPVARLSVLRHIENGNGGLLLMRDACSSPLAACMKLMAERMHTASKEEMAALYEACVSLLVAAGSRFETVVTREPAAAVSNPLLREIFDYTHRNIADGTLGPHHVARSLGISVRYLHKLFAASGMTFGSYVVMRRLDHVRNELVAGGSTQQTIAQLAQSWGFRDISAFNRAFRKRFGCAPRRLRARVAA